MKDQPYKNKILKEEFENKEIKTIKSASLDHFSINANGEIELGLSRVKYVKDEDSDNKPEDV